jgi:nucleotidyltransferase/DNA polymerase involved in DNA repair
MDCFFAQVHELAEPGRLKARPIAVQQHQDIITVNYAARAAGVTKHMRPAVAREILGGVGGVVVHAFSVDGRVSYQRYREASGAVADCIADAIDRAGAGAGDREVAVLEKASIDEFYVEGGAAGLAGAVALAATLRAAVKQQLGLNCSAGVASNKLLAKLVTARAKPDGQCHAVDGADSGSGAATAMATSGVSRMVVVPELLAATSVQKLPGVGPGSKLGKAISSALPAVQTVAELAEQLDCCRGPTVLAALATELGIDERKMHELRERTNGADKAPVIQTGLPATIVAQMSLSADHRQGDGTTFVAASGSQLKPVTWGDRGTLLKLVLSLATDVANRVAARHSQHRQWPKTLTVGASRHGHGKGHVVRSKSCPYLALPAAPEQLGAAVIRVLVELAADGNWAAIDCVTRLVVTASRFGSASLPQSTLNFSRARGDARAHGSGGAEEGKRHRAL